MTAVYRDLAFSAQDGLQLHYRQYGDPLSPALPVVCLAGLTRNAADFHDLAARLAPRRRVLALDLRGRGASAWDPEPAHYVPETYVLDIIHLLTVSGCHRVVFFGTSLGGLLSMALAAVHPTAVAGVVLNDIGPEIDPRGLERIRGYAGGDPGPLTGEQACAHIRRLFEAALPDLSDEDWRAEVERTFHKDGQGRYVLAYDPAVARAATGNGAGPPDMWPHFRALQRIPTLAIRGGLSDILSADTFERMAAAKPDLQRIVVPNRGHVPLLNEPECTAAIDSFLAQIDRCGH